MKHLLRQPGGEARLPTFFAMQSAPDNKAVKPKDERLFHGAVYMQRCQCPQRWHEVPISGVAVRCADCGAEMHWAPKEGR